MHIMYPVVIYLHVRHRHTPLYMYIYILVHVVCFVYNISRPLRES